MCSKDLGGKSIGNYNRIQMKTMCRKEKEIKPLVSVIMAAFNEERYIRRAIESILNQTYENIELIVVDDYSTDRSVEICRAIKDPRLRIHTKTNEPKNLASSRNIGVRMAKGEYIIYQDADDESVPTRIEKQLNEALKNPGKRVVGCSIKRIEKGIERVLRMHEFHKDIIKGFTRLYKRATIIAGTILLPKIIMQEIPYRVRFNNTEDWDHMLRLYESGKVEFYNCQEPLYIYFIRPKMMSFRSDWLDYNIFVRDCQIKRRKGLDEFKCIEEFLRYLDNHPLEKWKWFGLRKLIELKLTTI
jgi:glycosyltransferase involved in cell wall biosynthesis